MFAAGAFLVTVVVLVTVAVVVFVFVCFIRAAKYTFCAEEGEFEI